MDLNRVIEGNSMDVMADLPENSVHAVVTDPPYGLRFMGNEWDGFDSPRDYQEFSEKWARVARRVLKPGGHVVAFSGDKTHHRLFSGVEDAGYEIRHTIVWLNGNGMPKGARVNRWMDGDDSEEWEGFRTELKPAAEFAVLGRAPFDGPAYGNVLEHGTAALNIEETRVPVVEEGGRPNIIRATTDANRDKYGEWEIDGSQKSGETREGRYPTPVVLDAEAAEQLDEQVGDLEPGRYPGRGSGTDDDLPHGGGPSRFYYCAKASQSERSMNGKVENDHETVKPLDLMEWLVRMVTREGQVVLDPFGGSGTTALAAISSGRNYILIEKDSDHVQTARERIEHSEEILQDTLV